MANLFTQWNAAPLASGSHHYVARYNRLTDHDILNTHSREYTSKQRMGIDFRDQDEPAAIMR